MSDITRDVEAALKEWAAPDSEIDWPGAPIVEVNAEEIAGFLWERGLLKDDAS